MSDRKITEFNKDTVVVLPIPLGCSLGDECLFTIENALAFAVSHDRFYELDRMMRNNIPIRDAIRNYGITPVADELLSYVPENDKLKAEMGNIVLKQKKLPLADFDIQVLPLTAELQFFGKRVTLKQLPHCCEITRRFRRWTSESKRDDETLHVANLYEPYPCFDSFDSCDSRCYDNYVISDHAFTEDDCLEMEKSNPHYSLVNEDLSPKYLPIVYHDGGTDYMYVATSKDNPQVTPAELLQQLK